MGAIGARDTLSHGFGIVVIRRNIAYCDEDNAVELDGEMPNAYYEIIVVKNNGRSHRSAWMARSLVGSVLTDMAADFDTTPGRRTV